jgi:hypothetical protein
MGGSERSGRRNMSEDVRLIEKEGYLHFEFAAEFSIPAAKRAVDEMVNTCMKRNCTRVLFDCRRMTGPLSTMDRFDVAQYGSEKIERSIRIAMLGREDQVLPDKFFENVAVNRGMDLKLFTDIDEAVGWLKQ